MTQEQIDSINKKAPFDQGIFFQPNGVPLHIKELVIYSKYDHSGRSGGDCWGSDAKPYINDVPRNHFEVLDLVLQEIHPNCTYLQYRQIRKLIQSDTQHQFEYYGNFSEWEVEWIALSELEKLVDSWNSQS